MRQAFTKTKTKKQKTKNKKQKIYINIEFEGLRIKYNLSSFHNLLKITLNSKIRLYINKVKVYLHLC